MICNRLFNRVALARICLVLLVGCAADVGDDEKVENVGDEAQADGPGEGLDAPTRTPPPGAPVLTLDDGSPAGEVHEKSASCSGIFDPCGIVYNRSSQTLQLARDASSHFYCKSPKNFRDLPPGADSNKYGSPHWPDVDCVRSRTTWMFTNGRYYPPNEWVRVWSAKWVY